MAVFPSRFIATEYRMRRMKSSSGVYQSRNLARLCRLCVDYALLARAGESSVFTEIDLAQNFGNETPHLRLGSITDH